MVATSASASLILLCCSLPLVAMAGEDGVKAAAGRTANASSASPKIVNPVPMCGSHRDWYTGNNGSICYRVLGKAMVGDGNISGTNSMLSPPSQKKLRLLGLFFFTQT